MQPLISIITPCYNQAPFLDDCLQSVLDQTYTNWECIVLNDGSTDNTHQVAEQWLRKDSRFIYIKKENSGVSDTRNFGIQHAKGKYILPLDGDDMIGKEYLADAVAAFQSDPDAKLVYCNTLLFGKIDRQLPSRPYNFREMFTENQIPNAAFFKKSDFSKTNGFNINMSEGLEDWDFWLSFINEDDAVVKIDKYHLLYRIKDISRSAQIDREKNERLLLQIFKNNEEKYLKYFNPMRDHIEADFYKKEVQNIQNTLPFKVGKIVSLPITLAKRAINRIFR